MFADRAYDTAARRNRKDLIARCSNEQKKRGAP
jgi:hypothetical protein